MKVPGAQVSVPSFATIFNFRERDKTGKISDNEATFSVAGATLTSITG